MNTNLEGMLILNTRPVDQAHALTQALQEQGAQVLSYPTLIIAPVATDWLLKIPNPDEIKQIIFTSANAVHYFFARQKSTLPATISITAIGEGTMAALKKNGYTTDFLPQIASSEGLLALNNLASIQDQKILLVKGIGGRTMLQETLQKRGAHLTIIEVYQRLMPEEKSCTWQKMPIDIILATSETSICNLLKSVPDEKQDWVKQIPMLVISERLATIAKGLKIRHIIQSRPDNIVETLCQFKQGLSNGQRT